MLYSFDNLLQSNLPISYFDFTDITHRDRFFTFFDGKIPNFCETHNMFLCRSRGINNPDCKPYKSASCT